MTRFEKDVPPGCVASIVTHLTMDAPARPRADPGCAQDGVTLERALPDAERYLALFRRIGEPWMWHSRLRLAREDLRGIIEDPRVHIHLAQRGGADIGLVELDFRVAGECELAFFGLIPEAVGAGLGRWMMNRAITLGFAEGVSRLHLHTCTMDHPGALGFYVRSGFVARRQELDVVPDPRLTGVLPRNAAPHVPVFDPG